MVFNRQSLVTVVATFFLLKIWFYVSSGFRLFSVVFVSFFSSKQHYFRSQNQIFGMMAFWQQRRLHRSFPKVACMQLFDPRFLRLLSVRFSSFFGQTFLLKRMLEKASECRSWRRSKKANSWSSWTHRKLKSGSEKKLKFRFFMNFQRHQKLGVKSSFAPQFYMLLVTLNQGFPEKRVWHPFWHPFWHLLPLFYIVAYFARMRKRRKS